MGRNIILFQETDFSQVIEGHLKRIKEDLDKRLVGNIERTDPEEFAEEFYRSYSFQPVSLLLDQTQIDIKTETIDAKHTPYNYIGSGPFEDRIPQNVVHIYLYFRGYDFVFTYRPLIISTKRIGAILHFGTDIRKIEIVYLFDENGRNEIQNTIDDLLKYIEKELAQLNEQCTQANREIKDLIIGHTTELFEYHRKNKSDSEQLMLSIRKTPEPPKILDVTHTPKDLFKGKFISKLSSETYNSIVDSLFSMSLVFEKNPETFVNMKEPDIRNIFLVFLNVLYQGEATGETFNKYGRTDILVKHEGINIFLAECKIWHRKQTLIDAIAQVLNYATWRDSDIAVLLFNRTVKMSTVLNQVDEIAKTQPGYEDDILVDRNNGIFKYVFKRTGDAEIKFNLSILVFNIPKKAQ